MVRKHYGWKVGEPPPEIGAHSLAKHSVFKKYLDRYIRIVSPHPAQRELNLTIVDGFCGGGKYLHNGEVIFGSPFVLLRELRATEAALSLDRKNGFLIKSDFFFVDNKKAHAEYLRDELESSEFKHELGKSIHVRKATFESQAPEITNFIRRKGTSHRSLFFLDQYGWSDVSFEVIRRIFGELKHPEVLLTFSVDSLIDYFRAEIAQTRAARAVEIDPTFASHLTSLKSEMGARYLIQNFLYQHILKNTAARFYTPFFIRSADNHRSYWLLHLSTRERARDEMARLHWEMSNVFVHYGQAGFNSLGYDANVDPDQQKLEFDFGSDAQADSLNAAIEQLPRLIRNDTIDREIPITLGDLFRARCNDTPLTLEIVSNAIVKLRDEYREVEVLNSDGKLRPSAKHLGWNDTVRIRKQSSFLRAFD